MWIKLWPVIFFLADITSGDVGSLLYADDIVQTSKRISTAYSISWLSRTYDEYETRVNINKFKIMVSGQNEFCNLGKRASTHFTIQVLLTVSAESYIIN